MRLINKSIYALALASMMGLWSCSQDEALPGGQTTAKGHPVPVTLTVSRGDAQTRTELSENLQNGGLNDVWESGDKLAVYNAEGLYAGELTISDGWGTDTGVFTGEVTAETGQHEFNLWYTDPAYTGTNEESGMPIYVNTDKEMVVDLSKMPKFNSVKDLSAMDILSKKIKLNIKDNQATLVKDEKMVAHLAMVRFSLNGIPTENNKAGTLIIRNNASTESTDGVKAIVYKSRLGLADSQVKGTAERPEGIVVENVKAGDDVYLAFIPGTYTLSFHMEFDGVNYDYAFQNSTPLDAGVYYNAFTKAEGAETGTIEGVNITLNKEILAELHLDANFEGANPSEIVVVRSFGDKDSYTFDLTQPYESYVGVDNKTLPLRPGYTFLGWRPGEGDPVDKATTVYKSSDSARKAYYEAVWEAEASVDHSKNPLKKWAESNLVYSTATATSTLASNYYSRTSLYQWGNNRGWQDYKEVESVGWNVYNKDAAKIANSKSRLDPSNALYMYQLSTLTGYKKYFNMNCQFSESDYPEDYWPAAERQNDDWEARSSAYGFTKPLYDTTKKYRVPSSEDYKEILPSNLNITSATTLINGWSELKKYTDYNVQFHWQVVEASNSSYVLEIKALVVAKSKTKVDETLWKDANVVTRHFGSSGYVGNMAETYYMYKTTSGYTTYYQSTTSSTGADLPSGYRWTRIGSMNIINPMPNGGSEANIYHNGNNYWVNLENIVDGWENNGHYWTSDGYSMEFSYDPQDKYGEGSFLRLNKDDKSMAYAVRVIIED